MSNHDRERDDELLHLASEERAVPSRRAADEPGHVHAELRFSCGKLPVPNPTELSTSIEIRSNGKQSLRESEERAPLEFSSLQTVARNSRIRRDILEAFATMALISLSYFALPSHYRLKPDWQEAAVIVMITSVAVFFTFKSWRKIALWTSLVISSAIQLVLLHVWTQRVPMLSRGEERGAGALGVLLFLAVYGVVRFLQRRLYDKETTNRARDDSRSYPVGEKSR